MCSRKLDKIIGGSMLTEISTCEQVKVNIRRTCSAKCEQLTLL